MFYLIIDVTRNKLFLNNYPVENLNHDFTLQENHEIETNFRDKNN